MKGIGAVGLSFTLPKSVLAQSSKVNFYNWDTYIGETTLDDFTAATGIAVQYDLFADNEELFAKFRNGNPGFDLIVPTNDFVERFIVAGMLRELDHSRIPNMVNLDPAFADPAHDPGRRFSIPYMWGTVGIGYRISATNGVPDSWSTLYTSDEYANKIALLGDATTVLQMAFKQMGVSINDWSDEHIAAATAMIIAQKPRITAFAPDNGQDLLLAGEVDLAMEWNGDILQAMDEDDDIGIRRAQRRRSALGRRPVHPQRRTQPRGRARADQLYPRRRGRCVDCGLHLLRHAQRRGAQASQRGLQRKPGDLPAR